MKVVIQNLQKKKGLATSLIEEVDPDVFLEHVPEDGPAVFGGDWNSWTPAHVDAISSLLVPLDHVFLRGLQLVSASSFSSGADHLGAILHVELAE